MLKETPTLSGGAVPRVNSEWLWIGLLLLLNLPMLLLGLDKEHLGYDEIFSATFSVQSMIDIIISTLRFDLHPPLYYLQLYLWATISHTTLWLFLNSVFFTILSIVSIFFVARPLLSQRSAAIAAALFGLMPATVLFAHSLRMYAMLTFLAIWIAHFTYRLILEPNRRHSLLLLILTATTTAYNHATGFLIAAYGGLYGLLLLIEHRPPPRYGENGCWQTSSSFF